MEITNQELDMQVYLAQPRGFCAGVQRAIDIVEMALEKFGPPVYVRHEIVHNKHIVEGLRTKGVVFVDHVEDIPDGAVTIFSAHGVAEQVEMEAHQRNLPVVDATCPLVSKVHVQVRKFEKEDRDIILIGHRGHPEVEGTAGRSKRTVHIVETVESVDDLNVENPDNLAYVTQTTLSVNDTREIIDALKRRFPSIKGPSTNDICYATQNRQESVKNLSQVVDLILVVGAENSSNSNRLVEIGLNTGTATYLIDGPGQVRTEWFEGVERVGLTAGASAPEELVIAVIDRLRAIKEITVINQPGISESIQFKLPSSILNPPLNFPVQVVTA